MVARSKECLYDTFREIPVITNRASDSETKRWKANPALKKCYDKLNQKVDPERPETHMKRIINDVFKRKDATPVQVALVMSVCETLFNPNNNHVNLNEEIIKPRLVINLVSF